MFICEIWCSMGIFLNSSNLICRSTDSSKSFRGSLRLRDNESRLYFIRRPSDTCASDKTPPRLRSKSAWSYIALYQYLNVLHKVGMKHKTDNNLLKQCLKMGLSANDDSNDSA